MNKVFLMGRFTADPEVKSTTGNNPVSFVRFTLAVDRRYKKEGDQTADFINCVAFKQTADFIGKYFHKGSKVAIEGRIQTGSYTNQENKKVYTTDIVIAQVEFAESKQDNNSQAQTSQSPADDDGFMSLADDYGLPFPV